MSLGGETSDVIGNWQAEVGNPLRTALREIRAWSLEGDRKHPRSIGRLELTARADGHLQFDGTGYKIEPGLAKVIADLARTFEISSYADFSQSDPMHREETFGSTVAFDLARQIADRNANVGYPVSKDLQPFMTTATNTLKRPKGRGDDNESRILRNRLMAWAIQRGVEFDLKPSRNRASARNPHSKKLPCVADLVVEICQNTGWISVTYNTALSAYTDLHYGGRTREDLRKFLNENKKPNPRRLLQRTNLDAIGHHFDQLDEILPRLQERVC